MGGDIAGGQIAGGQQAQGANNAHLFQHQPQRILAARRFVQGQNVTGQNGGIIMVVLLPGFLDADVRAQGLASTAEQARLNAMYPGDPAAAAAGLKAWDAGHPVPTTDVAKVADHIDHIRKTIGVDHIGLGGDYDGMDSAPVGMEDVSGYPALFVELARRGYSQADLEKIASGNMLRVLKAVEAYAASQKGQPPIETPVAE